MIPDETTTEPFEIAQEETNDEVTEELIDPDLYDSIEESPEDEEVE